MGKITRLINTSHRGGWPFRHPPNVRFGLNRNSLQAKGLVGWWHPIASQGQKEKLLNLAGPIHGIWADKINVLWSYDNRIGPVIEFPGAAGDQISFGDYPAVEGLDQFTLSIWVIFTGSMSSKMVIAKHGGGTDGTFYLGSVSTVEVRFTVITDDGRVDHSVAMTSSLNVPYHFVGVYNGADIRIYKDGQELGTPSAQTGPTKANSQEIWLGDYNGAAWELPGKIGETRLYNRALSAGEVLHHYNNPWELIAPEIPIFYSIPIAPVPTILAVSNLPVKAFRGGWPF